MDEQYQDYGSLIACGNERQFSKPNSNQHTAKMKLLIGNAGGGGPHDSDTMPIHHDYAFISLSVILHIQPVSSASTTGEYEHYVMSH
jgi:hypothetical protein